MPFADFNPSQAGVVSNRRIIDNADFAVSLMERATKHTALLQDIEQKKEKFVTDQLLDSGRIEEQALRVTQMKNQQEFEAKTREHRLAQANAEGLRANAEIELGKFEEGQLSKLSTALPKYLQVLEDADSQEAVLAAVSDAQATFGGLAASKTRGPQAKAFLDQIAATATAKMEPYALRAQTAARNLFDEMDGTPEKLNEVERHPSFRYALQEPEFKKAYMEAKKADRDSKLKMAEQAAKAKDDLATAKARKGTGGAGSKLTDTAVQSIGSFQIAERDLADVEAAFNKISKDWRTGPITARAAGWTTTWNKDFKVMEQLINATVPNLARGVFREVGVLTDTDVERYRNMLPNAKSDPEVAKALFLELDKKLRRGYEMVIDNYRRAGRDVSGFEPNLPGTKAQKAPATWQDMQRAANGGK